MNNINLYLDDLRTCPDNFVLAKTVDEAIELINNNKIGIMSLDHDLGNINGEILPTGYDFVKYICEHGIKCDAIFIHTDNVVGRDNMYETLLGAQRRGFIDKNIKIYRYGYIH